MDYLTAWVIMVLLLDGQSLSEESFFFSYCRAMLKISGGWYHFTRRRICLWPYSILIFLWNNHRVPRNNNKGSAPPDWYAPMIPLYELNRTNELWKMEIRGSHPFSPSAGLPLNSLFAQKSIIICSARMRCKDNEIMHNNKEKQPKSCIIRINCLTLPPKGSDYDLW